MNLLEKKFCDRCGKDITVSIMSMFNMDIICTTCKEKERAHPDYEKASATERQAVKDGIRNFPGIGKPENL